MIYLRRISVNRDGKETIDIEALESDHRLGLFLERGYKRVTRDQYVVAWQAKDKRTIVQPQPKERAVGGFVTPPIYTPAPNGFRLFHVKKGV